MRSWAVKTAILFSTTALLAGCGGGSSSSKTNSTVAQVTLGPSTVSLVAGQVQPLSVATLNANSTAVTPAPTVTFNSSNPNLVTIGMVQGQALACGGVWDSQFVVCNGNDSSGHPLVGTATITATAGGVSSAPIQVSVHPVVTSIQVTQLTGSVFPKCNSNKTTAQFKAQAFSNGVDITNLVGSFGWTQSGGNAVSVDTNGLATALSPGLGGVIATLGAVSSPAVQFKSCLPVKIILHLNGDPAGMPTESVTMNVSDTKTVQADMVDENNFTVASAPGVSIVTNNVAVASVAGTTVTAQSAGGAGLLAVCTPPNCGGGLTTPLYSNLFSVTVNGGSGATTVYATTTFAPPTASPTPTIIPIDTSKTPPAAGTAINMPCPSAGCAVPNSMVFAANGGKAYLGTSQGLAALDTSTNVVTLLDPFVGKVLAVSPDGNTIIESNAASAPDPITGTMAPIDPRADHQRVVIVNVGNSSVQSFVLPGAVAASFTGDGFKAFVAADCSHSNSPVCPNTNTNAYVFSPFLSLQFFNLGNKIGANSNTVANNVDVATLASGPFAFFANVASPNATGLMQVSTCNNAPTNPPSAIGTTTPNIQFVQSFKNADVFVAVDSTGLDIETATVTALPPTIIDSTNCAPSVTYSNQFIDFGLGPFTARQLIVGTNVSSHIAVLPVGINRVLVGLAGSGPGTIPLAAGGTEALSGSMTLDGDTLWVGVAGSNNVDRIDLLGSADNLQIATTFKKSDGTAAPPNIVAVKPK
jgi:hypothetical protein